MTGREAFAAAVEDIAQRSPVYRTGGTGEDGTCDCIGLVMGAMYLCGHSAYPMHSSNYFARFQTENLHELENAHLLRSGDVVYKARAGAERLHERYLPGGRYDNGDPLDYYHAGVVLQTEPVCIVHCTSADGVNGIVRQENADGWTHFGCVKGVGEAEEASSRAAEVQAPEGRTVNLRARPDRTAAVLARIPVGSAAQILETADDWAKVRIFGRTGYMMKEYLKENEQEAVSIPRQALQAVADALLRWL